MKKKLFAALMAATLALGVALPAAAVQLQTTDPAADGYVSLHQYISPTSDPTVFKVTHTVLTNIKKPAVFISFVLDSSGSMGTSDIVDADGGGSSTVTRYEAVRRSMTSAVDTLLKAGANVDLQNTFINIIEESGSYSLTEQISSGSIGSVTASGLGNLSGYIPLLKTDGTENPDVRNAIAKFQQTGNSNMQQGFTRAYDDLKNALLKSSGAAGAPAWSSASGSYTDRMKDINIEDASRYIMVLGDGDAYGTADTSFDKISAAKYPTVYDASGKMASGSYFGETYALGATVWSTVYGRHGGHRSDWTGCFTNAATSYQWLNSYATWQGPNPTLVDGGKYWEFQNPYSTGNFRVVEPFMVAVSYAITSGYGTGAHSSISPTSPLTWTSTGVSVFGNAIDRMITDNGGGALTQTTAKQDKATHFFWVQHIGSSPLPTGTTQIPSGDGLMNDERLALGSESGTEVFKKFVEAATDTGTAIATGTLQSGFTVTKVPGYPLYTLSASDGSDPGTATVSGTSISWKPTLTPDIEYSLVYYVKADSTVNLNSFLNVVDMSISFTQGTNTSTARFPSIYVKVDTGETKTDKEAEITTIEKEAEKTTTKLMPIVGGQGTLLSRAVPEINGVSSKKLTNGRTQVTCDVKNGSDFCYQWQYKDTADKWIDITGANSSTYTLGRPLVVGKTYELRCVVSNSRGTKVISEVIKATYTKSAVSSESLVTAK